MSTAPSPKITRPSGFPLIWLVPLLALAVSLWLGIRELINRGPQITIEFASGSGLEANKTVLEYRGVAAGMVKAIELRPDLHGVIVHVGIKKESAALANGGSVYWIVHPEIGAGGVSGLDTLVSGVRLAVRPGTGPRTTQFRGLDHTPPPAISDQGRTFILTSAQLGSLTTGSPVMYRQLKVGQVEASRLSDDATSVLIRIHVDDPYGDLVRLNTRFWNAGGFNFKLNLLGAEIKQSSLESLISGGIGFATPDQTPLAPPAVNGAQFDLATEAQKDWLKWQPRIPIQAQEGSPQRPDKTGILPGLLKP
jgi:paraquat-inducible protein B